MERIISKEEKIIIMISATEARKITEESRSKLQKTIDEIDYYIDDAIHEGKHAVIIDGFY